MKHKTGKLAALGAAIVMAALVLTGCGVQVTGFALQVPESVAVGERVSAELTAEYDRPEAEDAEKEKALGGLEIIWASSDEAVATVDETGAVTGVADGTAVITATAGELRAEAAITVFVPLEGIDVPKTLELALNKTESARLAAKPVPANARVEGVPVFASSDETVVTVSADGTVTAVAKGEAVITVTLGGKSAETRVTVAPAATGIALEKTEGVLYVGGSYTLQPYPLPEDAPEGKYTFVSSDSKIATVSEAGVITAKSAGTAKITVTSAEGLEAVYTLTVKNKPAASTGGTGSAGGNSTANSGTGGNDLSGGSGGNDGTQTPPSEPTAPPSDSGSSSNPYPPGSPENPYNGGHGATPDDGQSTNGWEGNAW